MSALLLVDAKAHMGITVGTYDSDLQSMIDSAEATIGQWVGPLSATAVTSRVATVPYVVTLALDLPVAPVISLTSVTPVGGTALTLSDFYLNTRAGVITYNLLGASFPSRAYDVVYQAGRTTCPPDLLYAVKELVRHLWEARRAAGAPRTGSPPTEAMGSGVGMLPMRVQQAMQPYLQAGFA